MKKVQSTLITAFLCLVVSTTAMGQSAHYRELKAYLINEGFSISTEQYADLAQGETAGHTKTFYKGTSYVIIAVSDDNDVRDVDIYLNNTNGGEYDKDTSTESYAVLKFEPSFTRDMRIVIKNYASNTPYYSSRCRFIIAYK